MLTKTQVWNAISGDIKILKHLATKIPEGKENYKPTEKQRTTLELIQYLSFAGIASMRVILEGDTKIFGEYSELSKQTTVANFSEMLDKEEAMMKECFDKFTDEEFEKELDLWGSGHKEKKSDLILGMVVKSLASYKMQLFLYIKASGNQSIGTSNVWMGRDAS